MVCALVSWQFGRNCSRVSATAVGALYKTIDRVNFEKKILLERPVPKTLSGGEFDWGGTSVKR